MMALLCMKLKIINILTFGLIRNLPLNHTLTMLQTKLTLVSLSFFDLKCALQALFTRNLPLNWDVQFLTIVMLFTKTQLNLISLSFTQHKTRLCRFVLDFCFLIHHCLMYDVLKWESLNVRRHTGFNFLIKCIHFNYPPYLQHYPVTYSSS